MKKTPHCSHHKVKYPIGTPFLLLVVDYWFYLHTSLSVCQVFFKFPQWGFETFEHQVRARILFFTGCDDGVELGAKAPVFSQAVEDITN